MELLFRYLLFLLVKHWVQIGFPQTLMIPGDFLLIHKVRQAMIMLSTSCESSKQWLMKMQMDKTYILIYDGHGSHVRGQFLDHCLQNKIHPLLLFPCMCIYCSHSMLVFLVLSKRPCQINLIGLCRLKFTRYKSTNSLNLIIMQEIGIDKA